MTTCDTDHGPCACGEWHHEWDQHGWCLHCTTERLPAPAEPSIRSRTWFAPKGGDANARVDSRDSAEVAPGAAPSRGAGQPGEAKGGVAGDAGAGSRVDPSPPAPDEPAWEMLHYDRDAEGDVLAPHVVVYADHVVELAHCDRPTAIRLLRSALRALEESDG